MYLKDGIKKKSLWNSASRKRKTNIQCMISENLSNES